MSNVQTQIINHNQKIQDSVSRCRVSHNPSISNPIQSNPSAIAFVLCIFYRNFEILLGTPACSINSNPRAIQFWNPVSLGSNGKSSQTAFSESAYVDHVPLGTSDVDHEGNFARTHV